MGRWSSDDRLLLVNFPLCICCGLQVICGRWAQTLEGDMGQCFGFRGDSRWLGVDKVSVLAICNVMKFLASGALQRTFIPARALQHLELSQEWEINSSVIALLLPNSDKYSCKSFVKYVAVFRIRRAGGLVRIREPFCQ